MSRSSRLPGVSWQTASQRTNEAASPVSGSRYALKFIFSIPPDEVTFARRGFQNGEARARRQLEQVGRFFLRGYHAALEDNNPDGLALRLNDVEPEFRGFAFEGAAMGLSLLDLLTPWRKNRWRAFAEGSGASHVYMAHIGVGWALAKLHCRVGRALARLDPLLGWLAVDGYGFQAGFFHWPRYVRKQARPRRLSGYALRAFDQGLGRSLWFVDGADVGRIGLTIAGFSGHRRGDLWSGVGLACAYAGGFERSTLEKLRVAAGSHIGQVAQGAAFAAKARHRAGNLVPHTEVACEVLCGMSAREASEITDIALAGLADAGPQPAYEMWRRKIQLRFANPTG